MGVFVGQDPTRRLLAPADKRKTETKRERQMIEYTTYTYSSTQAQTNKQQQRQAQYKTHSHQYVNTEFAKHALSPILDEGFLQNNKKQIYRQYLTKDLAKNQTLSPKDLTKNRAKQNALSPILFGGFFAQPPQIKTDYL